MTANYWNTILSQDELDARYTLTASLDPRVAREERAYYESRTLPQLRALAAGCWNACERDGYQMAQSYAARLDGRT